MSHNEMHKRFQLSLLLLTLLLLLLPSRGASGGQADSADMIEDVARSVVHIWASGDSHSKKKGADASTKPESVVVGPGYIIGSGFIISPDGYILTQHYLVEDFSAILVRTGDKLYPTDLIGIDPRIGIALLKIDGSNLPAVKIGDPTKLRLTERVFAIGIGAVGYDPIVSDGIISSLIPSRSSVAIGTSVNLMPPMGGGPLINQTGQVVGITGMIVSRSTDRGFSFAIPINDAMERQSELRLKKKK